MIRRRYGTLVGVYRERDKADIGLKGRKREGDDARVALGTGTALDGGLSALFLATGKQTAIVTAATMTTYLSSRAERKHQRRRRESERRQRTRRDFEM